MFTPLSFNCLIRERQVMASLMSPNPCESKNLQGRICTFQFTPTTPTPLLPTAPRIPDTWVPWLLSSNGSQELFTALNPWTPAEHRIWAPLIVVTVNPLGADQTLAARSG